MPVQSYVETLKLLIPLLQSQLDLADDRVLAYNEKWNLPKDHGIYLAIGLMNVQPFGVSVRTQWNVDTQTFEEYQEMHERQMYSLNVVSRDRSAQLRCHEVVFAMNSIESQQLQELHNFKIADLPVSFVDASNVEGAARLQRYALTFNVIRSYARTRDIGHYDQFSIPPQIYTNQ